MHVPPKMSFPSQPGSGRGPTNHLFMALIALIGTGMKGLRGWVYTPGLGQAPDNRPGDPLLLLALAVTASEQQILRSGANWLRLKEKLKNQRRCPPGDPLKCCDATIGQQGETKHSTPFLQVPAPQVRSFPNVASSVPGNLGGVGGGARVWMVDES